MCCFIMTFMFINTSFNKIFKVFASHQNYSISMLLYKQVFFFVPRWTWHYSLNKSNVVFMTNKKSDLYLTFWNWHSMIYIQIGYLGLSGVINDLSERMLEAVAIAGYYLSSRNKTFFTRFEDTCPGLPIRTYLDDFLSHPYPFLSRSPPRGA